MQQYRLSFGNINVLREDIAEVIVDEGIEMDLTAVEEYHDFLFRNLTAPFRILINKINSYTFTFEAQLALGDLAEILAQAAITYHPSARISSEHMRDNIPRRFPWNLQTFDTRDEALSWLIQQGNDSDALTA